MTPWRLLTSDGVGAAAGLAFDEAMMRRYGRGGAPPPPTLRLYTYRPHCALVGRYQSLAAEVDPEACRRLGVEVGRRPTGGGAIIMGPDQLGVAIAARAAPEEAPRETLRRYAAGVVAGLGRLGIAAAFRAKNDLEAGGRKIAGLGLYLDAHGAVLFHASVLVDLDVPLMLQVLRIPGAKLSDKAAARVEERVTTVRRETGRAHQTGTLRDAFAAGFREAFGVELQAGELDGAERERCVRLERERYGCDAWISQRSPRRDARGTALLKTPQGLVRIYVALHGGAIKSVLVNGDFNVLPPGVQRLEAGLKWSEASRQRVRAMARQLLAPDELGVGPEVVADGIWEATRQGLALERHGHPERAVGSCYFPEPVPSSPGEDEARGGGETW